MPLLLYGAKLLNQDDFLRVTGPSKELGDLKDEIVSILQKHKFSGATAPQFGVPVQLAVVATASGFLGLVNPYISRMYGAETEAREDCISCPPRGNGCRVMRMDVIEVRAGTIEEPLNTTVYKFRGVEARTVQHEIDHLCGTFCVDRTEHGRERNVFLAKFGEWYSEWQKNGKRFPYQEEVRG